MPPELMRFLESMRTRGRAGESRQRSGMYKELKALEEYEADINRQATTKSKQQSRRKSKGSWGGILGGMIGLAILSAATGGLATAPTLALMGAAGAGAGAGTVIGGARGGKLRGGVGDIKGTAVPQGAFKRFEGARVRGKEKLDDINTQLGIGRDTFKSSITSNALNAALSAYLGAGQIRGADAGIRSFGQAEKQLGWGDALKATFKYGGEDVGRLTDLGATTYEEMPDIIKSLAYDAETAGGPGNVQKELGSLYKHLQTPEAGRLAEKGVARAASLTPEQIYAQSIELNKIAPSVISAYEPPTFGETGIGRAVTSGGDWLKALLTFMHGEQTNPWQRPSWTP